MKMGDIIQELQISLPLATNLFNDNFSITAATVDVDGKITFTTSQIHDLAVGDLVNIFGVKNGLMIESFDYESGTALLQFPFDHGYNLDKFYQQEIEITGTDNANGKYPLIDVPDNTHLLIEYTGDPVVGQALLAYDEGFEGYYNVESIPDATSFVVPARTDIFIPPKIALSGGTMSTRIRISGAADMDRFNAIYTQQNDEQCWLVVTPPSNRMSRDRNVPTDAISGVAQPGAGSGPIDIRQARIETVEIYAVIPASVELSGRRSADIAEDIAWALYQSICAAPIPTLSKDRDTYALMPVSDTYFAYLTDNTTYTHQYTFERVVYVTTDDVAKPRDQTAPFRGLDLHLLPCDHTSG